jgi:hypothetical protein
MPFPKPFMKQLLGGGVFLAGSFHPGEDSETDQYQAAYDNPVDRYVHQGRSVDEPGNHDDETGQVNSE